MTTLLFSLMFLLTITMPVLLPSLRLLFFSPYLIYFLYQHHLSSSLWMALVCGLILDILTTDNRMGLLALNFTITTFLIYQLKPYFFPDRFITFPLLTFAFALTSAILYISLNSLFHIATFPSTTYVAKTFFLWDILLPPLYDALFAAILFLCLHRFRT